MKIIRKILYVIIVLFVAVVAASSLAVVIYKDKIIDLLKTEIDKKIATKLEVESIDIKLLKGFPNISIQFTDVRFHSSFNEELLLESKQIYFVLNIVDLINNDITIERLEIEDARLIIHKNKIGEKGYDVFVSKKNNIEENSDLDIKSIKLLNVKIINVNDLRSIRDVFNIKSLLGSASFSDSVYQIDINSKAIIEKSNKRYLAWSVGKEIYIETKATFTGKNIIIKTSELVLKKSKFNLNGSFGLDNDMKVLLNLSGSNLKYSELVGLLPKSAKKILDPYNGKGIIKFDAKLEGDYAGANWPGFTADFSLKDFQISKPELKYPLRDIDLIGNVHIPNIRNLKSAELHISKISALLNKDIIKMDVAITDFDNPRITGNIAGNIDVSWAMPLLSKSQNVFYGQGTGLVNLDLRASVNLIQKKALFEIEKYEVNGIVNFAKFGIDSLFSLRLKDVDGEIIFSNEKMTLTTLNGIYGESDFSINGSILSNPKEKSLEANLMLESNLLNLDEIVGVIIELPADSVGNQNSRPFKFNTSLSLNVNQVNFRKYNGKKFSAELLINENGIIINRATSNGMGGNVVLAGSITNQFNRDIYIEAKVRTQQVDLDSLFYVFDNFSQQFITADVMKGDLFSDVYTSMYFNEDWIFKRNLLYAEGILKVKNGELNNFEPIMSLSPYLNNEDENLSQLRFSDLESSIVISNDTVFISDMYIGSNVRNIKIGGYHTLLQQIDYRLSVPVINNKRDTDNEFGEVKKDKEEKLYMPFRITGTTSDYKVNYDLMKASSNLVKGIKKEIKDIGNTLIMKQKVEDKVDTLLLEDDEFFDWDNE